MASVILSGTPAVVAGGGGGGVASVAAGQYMINTGNATNVVLASTLGAGDGIEISAGGVVQSISVNLAAGAGITITPPAAAGDPVTIAAEAGGAGFTQYETAQTPIGNSPYPAQLGATAFGAGFTPATTGYYAVQFAYQPGTAVSVWGAGDVLQVGLYANGVATATYANWFGPSDPTALQTIETQTRLALLNAGQSYTFYWWALDSSGTLNLGGSAGGQLTAVIYAP